MVRERCVMWWARIVIFCEAIRRPHAIGLTFKELTKTNVITDQFSMPVSLAEFQRMFIGDSATFSVGDFHTMKKDTNFAMTPWMPPTSSSSVASSERVRELTFSRPLRGMKPTRATKYQKWINMGKQGCVLTSSTKLKDVPCSDCFSVDESMVVLSNGEHSVHVKISWEVQWLRSSFLKSLIESNTRSEMKMWQSSYLESMLQHVTSSPVRSNSRKR